MSRARTSRWRPGFRQLRVRLLPAAPPTFWLSAILVLIAFVLGGRSRDNPISSLVIELVGLALILAHTWTRTPTGSQRIGWPTIALLAAIFIVPLVQLVPLPPEVWTKLPGREMAVQTLKIAGIPPGWAPLSLNPDSTFQCLLWLVPPAALFLAVCDLDAGARIRIAALFLALCIASVVLGGLQLTSGADSIFTPQGVRAGRDSGLPIGFFANRNHQGIALAAVLPLAAAVLVIWEAANPRQRLRAAGIAFAAVATLLIVGVLGTRSRAALAISGPALVAAVSILWSASNARRLRPGTILTVGIASIAPVIAAQFGIGAVLDRFEVLSSGDGRFRIWPTTILAAGSMSPVGSGLGTFVPIYGAWEPLNQMGPKFANNAHSDYLELWLETGWLGPLIVLCFLGWFARATLEAWRSPVDWTSTLAKGCSVVVLALLAHSMVDYPLRTQALACLFAFAVACMATNHRPTANPGGGH